MSTHSEAVALCNEIGAETIEGANTAPRVNTALQRILADVAERAAQYDGEMEISPGDGQYHMPDTYMSKYAGTANVAEYAGSSGASVTALKDANNNDIITTYATKEEVSQNSGKKLLTHTITTTDGVADEDGVITGTTIFATPLDLDISSTVMVFDGALLVTGSVIDPYNHTITFGIAPLLGNNVTIFYYSTN